MLGMGPLEIHLSSRKKQFQSFIWSLVLTTWMRLEYWNDSSMPKKAAFQLKAVGSKYKSMFHVCFKFQIDLVVVETLGIL